MIFTDNHKKKPKKPHSPPAKEELGLPVFEIFPPSSGFASPDFSPVAPPRVLAIGPTIPNTLSDARSEIEEFTQRESSAEGDSQSSIFVGGTNEESIDPKLTFT